MTQTPWQKSTYSGWSSDSACVEVSVLIEPGQPRTVLIRESDTPATPPTETTVGKFRAFTDGVKAGEFDWIWEVESHEG